MDREHRTIKKNKQPQERAIATKRYHSLSAELAVITSRVPILRIITVRIAVALESSVASTYGEAVPENEEW